MIAVRDIVYRYPGSSEGVLRKVSLTIQPGEWVALMGSNGSGKTTLAQCLNGLLIPQEGEVIVDGLSTREEAHLFEIRRRVGMVFQNPDSQIVATTVEREIAFGLENLGLPQEEMVERVAEALARFDLTEEREAPPHLLSGGERQRLALASIWVMRPEYYVLDEPTSLLDPRLREEILAFIETECRRSGRGILFITQFSEETLRCDRLVLLSRGSVVWEGSPRSLFETQTLDAWQIDPPPEIILTHWMRELGLEDPV